MGERGVSLIEMVVTVCIVSILLGIGTLSFSEYLHSSRTESQTRMIYAELLKSRAAAVYERRGTRVRLYGGRFDVYSSSCDDSTVSPVQTQVLRFPVQCNASAGTPEKGYPLGFMENGLASTACSICTDGENDAAVDSIIIGDTRISIGKRQKGKDCNAANITIR